MNISFHLYRCILLNPAHWTFKAGTFLLFLVLKIVHVEYIKSKIYGISLHINTKVLNYKIKPKLLEKNTEDLTSDLRSSCSSADLMDRC